MSNAIVNLSLMMSPTPGYSETVKPEGSISMKAAKLQIGVLRQEAGGRRKEEEGKRKKEEGRSQKKCFYKYEMLPTGMPKNVGQ
ncbi:MULTISPECIES: hypothetical protein [unclassified Microcoleus]|uniref:hypothetical protein n=1 Tax=unclassified Microcoleus TaxID=2642155 RepID=UPI0040409614